MRRTVILPSILLIISLFENAAAFIIEQHDYLHHPSSLVVSSSSKRDRLESQCSRYCDENKNSFRRNRCILHGSNGILETNNNLVLDSDLISSVLGRRKILDNIDTGKGFSIREATYQDLNQVAEIIVESFYPPTPPVFSHYNLIRELARIQNNFSYGDCEHTMLVAVSNDSERKVIGFCDVDARPIQNRDANTPPRPYLSDLAIHSKWRRKGIASSMIIACEIIAERWKKDELFLRVEATNEAALLMYSTLGYSFIEHPFFGVKDTTMLLRRELTVSDDEDKSRSRLV